MHSLGPFMLEKLEIFYYVAELKSFSKAANRLNVSKSFISKKVTSLEAELKVKLFLRSTRSILLTEVGENLFSYCAKIFHDINEAYDMIGSLEKTPAGMLRVSMPPSIALNLLPSFLANFVKKFPQINLQVEMNSKLVDILNEGYDITLRASRLASSNLIAQKIYTIKNIVCASKKFFDKNQTPTVPNDLNKLRMAVVSQDKQKRKYSFKKNGKETIVEVNGSFLSNNLDLIKILVMDDAYIALFPEFMVKNELKNGTLISCLTDYDISSQPLYVVYPERKYMLPKLKVFIDMLKDYLRHEEVE